MNQRNMELKLEAKRCGVALWELAERCSFSESTLYNRLRRRLDESELSNYRRLIQEIADEKKKIK